MDQLMTPLDQSVCRRTCSLRLEDSANWAAMMLRPSDFSQACVPGSLTWTLAFSSQTDKNQH